MRVECITHVVSVHCTASTIITHMLAILLGPNTLAQVVNSLCRRVA